MSLTFNGAKVQVDNRIKKTPKGYREDKKQLEKMTEEQKEIVQALTDYRNAPTEENLKKLKKEFGDELFAIFCLANKLDINLDECFDLAMKDNEKKAKNDYKKEE